MSTSFSVRGSVLQAAQSMLSMGLGLALGLIVSQGLGLGTTAVVIVVVVGVLISGWRLLGPVGTWVPTMALFVILVGGSDPIGFAMANSMLALLGAVLGVVVLVVMPLTTTTAARLALRDLRDLLAQRLDAVADNLDRDQSPTTPEWQDSLPDLADSLWDARREVLTVADRERQDADPEIWPVLGSPVRDATRHAVRVTARVLRSGESGPVDPEALAEADAAAATLQRCVEPGDGVSASSAGMAVAHSIRRALWILDDRNPDR